MCVYKIKSHLHEYLKYFRNGSLAFLVISCILGLGLMIHYGNQSIDTFPIYFPTEYLPLFKIVMSEDTFGLKPLLGLAWFILGGGWEFQIGESLRDAGHREVMEECRVEISIERMMYLQEFHETEDKIALELFWFGTELSEQNKDPIDLDPNGQVEEVK